jgi:LysR family glycine cleavage system transcriptional activator
VPSAPRLPLNTLTAFRAVAEVENLRAAADALHLTHSAVSQQIRGLEQQLGFLLFERRGRRVVLNPAGQALLRSVQSALSLLDDGVQAAAAAAGGAATRLRVTVLPSFANRWLLPRIGRWRERHATLALEIDASMRPMDLQREGFHAGVRQGNGPWAGLESERLFEQPPIIVVGSPSAARRLLGAQPEALAREPLLGDSDLWNDWFAAAGIRTHVRAVAVFNDAGLMLQAAEQNLGLALSRELLAADALCDGRLVRLSPIAIRHAEAQPYHLVYPAGLRDWPPLASFRAWLFDELDRSLGALRRANGGRAPPKSRSTTRARARAKRG